MSAKFCTTCKWCGTDDKCVAVVDPTNGNPLPLNEARRDELNGYYLPCGYAGNKWQEKTR